MTPPNPARRVRRNAGFTLVEIMLVCAVIALVAAIGVPAWIRARKRAQATKLVNELRTIADAFQLYNSETRHLPPDSDPATIPAGMEPYMPSQSTWTTEAPGGGHWYWVNAEFRGFNGIFGVHNPGLTPEQKLQIDTNLDDGVADTGGVFTDIDGWVYVGVK
jgi:prepilin-type N-terminal cleavage/methylation domain-containing protein